MKKQLGIDLGTTNTVACFDDEILAIGDDGARYLPSAVAFLPNGSSISGQSARRRRAIDAANTIFSSKRIIGRRFHDSQTLEFVERYPFEVVDDGDDWPLFQTRAGRHSPTDIAASLLRRVSEPLGPQVRGLDVVITVPTGFTTPQRNATVEAARMAGFENLRLVDEAEATAYAYQSSADLRGLVAVYDLGGGTFDVSVLWCGEAGVRVMARASEPFLGGDDIDQQIADWARREVLKQHNWDLGNYAEVSVRLLSECERVKIRLASEDEARIDLSQVDPECPIAEEGLPIRRSLMDSLCMKLVQRTFLACDEALANAGVGAGDIHNVLLAGGVTQLPVIREGVEAYFGRPGLIDFDPTAVVALGASRSLR